LLCFFFTQNKRFDAQLKRQKQQITEMEAIEEELKQERRKLQKEVDSHLILFDFRLKMIKLELVIVVK